MASSVQTLYTKYQQKYPLYNKEKIVDMMLDDGVITFEDANKIKSCASLFLIDNKFDNKNSSNNNFNITEIWGGNFSTSKKQSKTDFNSKIEPTFQSDKQGDCWLLSDINALNTTTWGKQAIRDAIIPDKNSKGGVTINFKGSPLKEKNIYISAQQIERAKQSGNYSRGDDDMIAFELATEIVYRKMVKQGIAKRICTDEELQQQKINYRSYINSGVATKDFQQYPISKLLGMETIELNFFIINGYNSSNPQKEKDKILKFISTQKTNLAIWCAFAGEFENKYGLYSNHAYTIKKMECNKEVILIDPYYSDKEIRMAWKDFKNLINAATCSFNDTNLKNKIKQHLPNYYNIKNEEYQKRYNTFYQ